MRKSKRWLALSMSVLMLLSAAGCGGSETAATTAAPGSAAETTTGAAAGSDGMISITYLSDQALQSLDRYATTGSMQSHTTCMLWADSLIASDHAGTFSPWLATEWDMAEDSMSITMKLREGVLFGDGTPLTAEDVKFTFERLRDDKTLSESSVKKWRPYIGTVETPDEHTVVLNFASVMPTFFTEVSWLPILCKSAYDSMGAEQYWANPVGTGPYAVKSWDAVNCICEFEKKPEWWGYDVAQKSSNVDRITFKLVTEGTTRASSLRSGEVQICENVPAESIEVVTQEGFTMFGFEKLEQVFLQCHSGPGCIFEDKNLREAMSLCIDRQLLVDAILGSGSAATWPCLPISSGFRDTKSYEYNPEKAKELIAASGYNGEPINFICTSSKITRGNEITQAIQSMAQEAGLNLQIEMLEDAVYNDRRDSADFDLCIAAFSGAGNEFYNQVVEILGADRFKTEHQDQKLKELCEAVTTTADPVKQDELRAAAYAQCMESYEGGIYLYQPEGCFAWSPNLTGVTVFSDSVADYRFMNYNQ